VSAKAIGATPIPPAIPDAAKSAATVGFKIRMADPLYTAPEFGWTEGTSPTALPVEIQQHPQQLPRIAGTNNCRGVLPDVDSPLDAP
jgi:hypothetical protein